MLTILHDRIEFRGNSVELASSEGYDILAPSGATCRLARILIEMGYDSAQPVRVVRADPWLFGAPHQIGGVTLGLAARVDFFAETRTLPAEIEERVGR